MDIWLVSASNSYKEHYSRHSYTNMFPHAYMLDFLWSLSVDGFSLECAVDVELLICIRNCHLLSKVILPIFIPSSTVWKSPHFCQLLVLSDFNFCQSEKCGIISHCVVFNLHFPDYRWVWPSFMLIVHSVFLPLISPYSHPVPIILWHSLFFLLICRNSLNILDINPWLILQTIIIVCLLIQFMVSYY